jgi:hypothetical protein
MLGGHGQHPEDSASVGLSKSDWLLLEVLDLRVESLQIELLEMESRLAGDLEVAKEDQDRERELRVVVEALGELKAAAREMRAWAAAIASCG